MGLYLTWNLRKKTKQDKTENITGVSKNTMCIYDSVTLLLVATSETTKQQDNLANNAHWNLKVLSRMRCAWLCFLDVLNVRSYVY